MIFLVVAKSNRFLNIYETLSSTSVLNTKKPLLADDPARRGISCSTRRKLLVYLTFIYFELIFNAVRNSLDYLNYFLKILNFSV